MMVDDGVGVPYPGLRSFRRDETHIFFGREGTVSEMVNRLAPHRFLAVTGTSGSGKSSLVRTGLLDALERGLLAEAGSDWLIADFRPGTNPLTALAKAVVAVTEPALSTGLPAVEAVLARGPFGLLEWLKEIGFSPRTNLLLMVDQFEEIFRFQRGPQQEDVRSFVALLLASAAQRELRVYVVITMRSDFLGNCAQFPGLAESINDGQYLTPHMTREQCQRAIEEPARVFGGSVEKALVNRLLNDMGNNPDQLPLMQHALMRLWASASEPPETQPVLTLRAYETLGGIVSADRAARDGAPGMLSAHADEILRELTVDQQRLAQTLFRALTESEGAGGRDVRRPVTLDEAAAIAETSPDALVPVVEAFRSPGRNFLMPALPAPLEAETLIDISHESLIRQWSQLGEWVRDEFQSAQTYRDLARSAELRQLGRASYWRGGQLNYAVEWLKRERPNKVWASRYGGAFDLAIEFLGLSRRAQRRTRVAEALAGIVFVAAISSGAWYIQREQYQTEAMRTIEQNTEDNRKKLLQDRQYFAAQTVDRLLAQSQIQLARLVALNAIEETDVPGPELRRALANVVVAQGSGPALIGTHSPPDADSRRDADSGLDSMVFSPDGAFVAAVGSANESADRSGASELWDDQTIQLWDVRSGAVRLLITGMNAPIVRMAISSDSKRIAAGARDGQVLLWDSGTGKILPSPERLGAAISALAFAGDGRLFYGTSKGELWVWDPRHPSEGRSFSCAQAYMPASGVDVRADQGGDVEEPQSAEIRAVAVSGDSTRLMVGTTSGRLQFWDISAEKFVCLPASKDFHDDATRVSHDYDRPVSIVFGSDTSLAVVVGRPDERGSAATVYGLKVNDKTIEATKIENYSFRRHENEIRSVTFDAQHRQFLLAVGQGVLVMAEPMATAAKSNTPSRETTGGQGNPTVPAGPQVNWNGAGGQGVSLALAAGEKLVAVDLRMQWQIVVADAAENEPLQVAHVPSEAAPADLATVSPDHAYAAFVTRDVVHLRRLADGTDRQWSLKRVVYGLQFDPSSKRLAIGLAGGGQDVWLWSIGDDKPKALICPPSFDAQCHAADVNSGHTADVNSVAFDSTGYRLISASDDHTAIIWDVGRSDAVPIVRLSGHTAEVVGADFAADDIGAVTVSWDRTLRIWNPRTGELQDTIESDDRLQAFVLDQSRSRVAVMNSDASVVQVWDLRDLALAKADIHLRHLARMSFAETGELLTVDRLGRMAIWGWDAELRNLQLRSYGQLPIADVLWADLDPAGKQILYLDDGLAIAPPVAIPQAVTDQDLQAIAAAASTRGMTLKELRSYASPATIHRASVANSTSRTDLGKPCGTGDVSQADLRPIDRCLDRLRSDPSERAAWFELARLRGAVSSEKQDGDALDPALVIAAAEGYGPALEALGDWFARRGPSSIDVAGALYAQAIMADRASAGGYLEWFALGGAAVHRQAAQWKPLFEARAATGDPAANLVLAVLAEEAGVGADEAARQSANEEAFRRYAIAARLFAGHGRGHELAELRRAALARELSLTSPGHLSGLWRQQSIVATSDGALAPPSLPTWRADLSGLDISVDADLYALAEQAANTLARNLPSGNTANALPAEIQWARAAVLARTDTARALPVLVRAMQTAAADDRTEYILDRDVDTLLRVGEAQSSACREPFEKATVILNAWYEKTWYPANKIVPVSSAKAFGGDTTQLKPNESREIRRVRADRDLAACLERQGDKAAALRVLQSASDYLDEMAADVHADPGSSSPLELIRLRVALGEELLADGGAERALWQYDKALSLLDPNLGRTVDAISESDAQELLGLEQRIVVLLPEVKLTPTSVTALAGLRYGAVQVGKWFEHDHRAKDALLVYQDAIAIRRAAIDALASDADRAQGSDQLQNYWRQIAVTYSWWPAQDETGETEEERFAMRQRHFEAADHFREMDSGTDADETWMVAIEYLFGAGKNIVGTRDFNLARLQDVIPELIRVYARSADDVAALTSDADSEKLADDVLEYYGVLLGFLSRAGQEPDHEGMPITDCDRLAANPYDPGRRVTGVLFDKIDPDKAVEACQRAVAAEDGSGRLHYELGRALERAYNKNRQIADLQAMQAEYVKAVTLGSPYAVENLVGDVLKYGGDDQSDAKAKSLLRRKFYREILLYSASKLSERFSKGDGLPRDAEMAIALLRVATAWGDDKSADRLASLLSAGTASKKNMRDAYRFARIALLLAQARNDDDAVGRYRLHSAQLSAALSQPDRIEEDDAASDGKMKIYPDPIPDIAQFLKTNAATIRP